MNLEPLGLSMQPVFVPGPTPLTAEAFYAIPGDEPWELWRGVVRKVPGATMYLSALAGRFGVTIFQFVHEQGLGWVTGPDGGYILQRDPDTVVVPDVAFVKRERLPGGKVPEFFFPGGPDLLVEVKPQWDGEDEIAAKMALYRDVKVPIVWWVYPDEEEIEVYRDGVRVARLGIGDTLSGEEVIPGLRLALADLFADFWRR